MKKLHTAIELKFLKKLNDIESWLNWNTEHIYQHIQTLEDRQSLTDRLTIQQTKFIINHWNAIKSKKYVKNKLKELLKSNLKGYQAFDDALFVFEQSLITEHKQLIRKFKRDFNNCVYDSVDKPLNRIVEIQNILLELPTKFIDGSDNCYTPNERQLNTHIDCSLMSGRAGLAKK